jgi:hypothetical protein
MDSQHKFRVLVPSGHHEHVQVSGKIGATPDTAILGTRYGFCRRSRLPSYLNDLTFAYSPPQPAVGEWPDTVPNFFCFDDFFVRDDIKSFFANRMPGDFEWGPVHLTKGPDGPFLPDYGALKIIRTIDCVDPDNSYAEDFVGAGRAPLPFSRRTVRYELAESLAYEFANAEGNKYISYPSLYSVKNIRIIAAKVPHGSLLFQPACWPSILFIREDFARALEQKCAGGTMGYYFWTLDIDDVSGSYHKTQTAMR